jgi:hypothetical protein
VSLLLLFRPSDGGPPPPATPYFEIDDGTVAIRHTDTDVVAIRQADAETSAILGTES